MKKQGHCILVCNGLVFFMGWVMGLEPTATWATTKCSTNWATPTIRKSVSYQTLHIDSTFLIALFWKNGNPAVTNSNIEIRISKFETNPKIQNLNDQNKTWISRPDELPFWIIWISVIWYGFEFLNSCFGFSYVGFPARLLTRTWIIYIIRNLQGHYSHRGVTIAAGPTSPMRPLAAAAEMTLQ